MTKLTRTAWCGVLLATLGLTACSDADDATAPATYVAGKPAPTTAPATADVQARQRVADFAAGCFWGSEATFRMEPGVIATEVGFEGGHTPHPSYEDVCSDRTGYAETVRVYYDPTKVDYKALVDTFFEHHDPTTVDRQGPDAGTQYRSAIFFHSPEQQKVALADKAQREASGQYVGPIVTAVVPAAPFYRAEEYHQEYFQKNGMDTTCHLGNGKKS